LRETVAERLAARDRVLAERLSAPLAVAVLLELTGRLPDHSYAIELSLRDGEARLQGFSAATSELIGALDASPLFRSPEFRSPVTSDPRVGRDRFDLSAGIVQEEG
jgi:general secretion pathway protein L